MTEQCDLMGSWEEFGPFVVSLWFQPWTNPPKETLSMPEK